MVELILGGARSGKSRLAEKLAVESGLAVTYVATSQALDGEMSARIAQHQVRRPAAWALVEEPVELARVLREQAGEGRCLLVECLTGLQGRIILVSNETGLGVVPLGELTRRYVDEAGWLHQALAERSQRVIFTVAGLPMILKGERL